MIKQKGDTKLKVSLRDLQQDKEELERCQQSPVYFYNKYVRKEGQKILTEEEYENSVKKGEAFAILKGRRKDIYMYPITPEEALESWNTKKPEDATPGD